MVKIIVLIFASVILLVSASRKRNESIKATAKHRLTTDTENISTFEEDSEPGFCEMKEKGYDAVGKESKENIPNREVIDDLSQSESPAGYDSLDGNDDISRHEVERWRRSVIDAEILKTKF